MVGRQAQISTFGSRNLNERPPRLNITAVAAVGRRTFYFRSAASDVFRFV